MVGYELRRDQVEAYFDRTAAGAWEALTSDAPVSRIRATVREGRDRMRATLASWLAEDLRGARVLDAGCGTGAFSVLLAERGAEVVAVDLSETLIGIAKERAERAGAKGISFFAGDMLAPSLGDFDHVVAMDSLIHYAEPDMVLMLGRLAARAKERMVFTFAPRTPTLAAMHWMGQFFPRGDRAPAIEPIAPARLLSRIGEDPALEGWAPGRGARVQRGFYTSQGLELSKT